MGDSPVLLGELRIAFAGKGNNEQKDGDQADECDKHSGVLEDVRPSQSDEVIRRQSVHCGLEALGLRHKRRQMVAAEKRR